MRPKTRFLLIGAILLIAAFFRLYLITDTPPGLYPDEAANGNNAVEALRTGNFKIFYPENNGREGLFINIQTLSIKLFGPEPWALRVVSAFLGTLTVLGIYLLSQELFRDHSRVNASRVSLLAAFFLATSYWHVNFSRIGFRAIMVPLFATFSTYWLLKALRREKISSTVLAGVFTGLGFHTYIAFRFMPFILAVPIVADLASWFRGGKPQHCVPCIIALFLFVTFIVALPAGLYFLSHPDDFWGRSGQISIFSAESPLREFIKSNILTLGMFNVRGDCNQRHNFNCRPELFWPVGIFFLIGLFLVISHAVWLLRMGTLEATSGQGSPRSGESEELRRVQKSSPGILERFASAKTELILLAWFLFMMFPATLTREGLPHALRSIGLIVPAMIFAAWGAAWLGQIVSNYFTSAGENPHYAPFRRQIGRIRCELILLGGVILAAIAFNTYRDYFLRFANSPRTHDAFSSDLWQQGKFLAQLPPSTKKIVIVNLRGDDIRGVPAPAQTIMLATGTFGESERIAKNLRYVTNPADIVVEERENVVIVPMNWHDRGMNTAIKKKFPQLRAKVLGDFVIFENEK